MTQIKWCNEVEIDLVLTANWWNGFSLYVCSRRSRNVVDIWFCATHFNCTERMRALASAKEPINCTQLSQYECHIPLLCHTCHTHRSAVQLQIKSTIWLWNLCGRTSLFSRDSAPLRQCQWFQNSYQMRDQQNKSMLGDKQSMRGRRAKFSLQCDKLVILSRWNIVRLKLCVQTTKRNAQHEKFGIKIKQKKEKRTECVSMMQNAKWFNGRVDHSESESIPLVYIYVTVDFQWGTQCFLVDCYCARLTRCGCHCHSFNPFKCLSGRFYASFFSSKQCNVNLRTIYKLKRYNHNNQPMFVAYEHA